MHILFFIFKSENFLKFYSKQNNVGVDCIRISNGYGDPVLTNTNCWSIVINNLCLQAYNNKKMIINSNPNEFRNFIYVKDISREILNLIKKNNKKYLIKNIGSNQNVRIKEIIKAISKILTEINQKLKLFTEIKLLKMSKCISIRLTTN